ncbi:MAG TPA: hypothetical protein VLW45_00955 [Pelomicrobium sp.]|nr:hypothetical protein [Pelomicrobium sp.]
MNIKHTIAVAVIGFGLLAGCGGGDTTTIVQGTTTISKGKELEDLQRALNEGAITQKEYDQLRSIVMRRSK